MTKYECKCQRCGNEFESSNKNQKFCNRKCYESFRQENIKLKDRECLICGKHFKPYYSKQVFCSVKCRVASTENKIECVCDYCGKSFNRKKSEVDNHTHHYCSDECKRRAMWWSEKDTEILKDNYGKISYKNMINIFSVPKTVDEIKRRAIYLGLTSSKNWSEEEIKILIANYSIKPMNDIMNLLPNRSQSSILGQAKAQNLKSFFYLNHIYSQDEDAYLTSNYLEKSNEELGEYLHRSPSGIAQHLRVLNLHRPTVIDSYNDLTYYVRSRLASWKESVRKERDYTCELTGERSNVIVHHIRGFNLLMSETIEVLDFPIYENIYEYNQKQLDIFLETFLQVQESYHSYICINEEIHKQFHSIYGYGNNTPEQWDNFVETYYKK